MKNLCSLLLFYLLSILLKHKRNVFNYILLPWNSLYSKIVELEKTLRDIYWMWEEPHEQQVWRSNLGAADTRKIT